MDTLANWQHGVHFSGGLFLDAEFSAPWCIRAKIGPDDCSPYAPVPRNIIAYHYLTEGRLLLQVNNEPPLAVERGEIVLLPRNAEHRLASAMNVPPVSADGLIQSGADGQLTRIVHGGGGERCCIFCGFLGSDTPHDPILRLLPQVLKLNAAESSWGSWVESSFRFAAREVAAGYAQSQAVIGRLAELLFMEAVRRYLTSLPPGQNAWRSGLGDPMIGRALGLLHSRMRERWTTELLAREVGLSRSAFADRFARIMGEPPMQYLVRQRLQTASLRLQGSRDAIARIAFDVGYESEAAFNRAFKRAFGAPPAYWRKEHARGYPDSEK